MFGRHTDADASKSLKKGIYVYKTAANGRI